MAVIQKNPTEKKFGENRLVGFTDDGSVWVVYDCKAPDGKPMQMREILTPKQAADFAEQIIEAADKAHAHKKPLIVMPGGN